MGECPIKFSSLGVDWAERKNAIADPGHRNHLRIVSRRENLICFLEILVSESLLDYAYTTLAQQLDDSLTGNARQKGSVGNRREHDAILRHEDIRGREFGDVAEHIANNGIVEAARLRFKKRPRVVGIEAAGFGIDRHRLKRRPAIG